MHKKNQTGHSKRMNWRTTDGCCGRKPTNIDPTIKDMGLDPIATSVLTVARLFWQTFAYPDTQSWLFALQRAELFFGNKDGGEVGLEILATVQAMRMSRVSCFQFNDPNCRDCAEMLSAHERQFINIFGAVREGRMGSARTHAMLLCEGNDTDALITRMVQLAKALNCMTHGTRMDASAPMIH